MRSQSFTFLYHKPISCHTIFRYVFCVSLVSIFFTESSIGISCKKSENTLREFPLVIATVAKVSRKRGLGLVVRKKQQHFLTFSPENAAAFYFCK